MEKEYALMFLIEKLPLENKYLRIAQKVIFASLINALGIEGNKEDDVQGIEVCVGSKEKCEKEKKAFDDIKPEVLKKLQAAINKHAKLIPFRHRRKMKEKLNEQKVSHIEKLQHTLLLIGINAYPEVRIRIA